MDPAWQFFREWEKMKKRVEELERDVYWLKKYKSDKENEERAKNMRKD